IDAAEFVARAELNLVLRHMAIALIKEGTADSSGEARRRLGDVAEIAVAPFRARRPARRDRIFGAQSSGPAGKPERTTRRRRIVVIVELVHPAGIGQHFE